MSEELKAIETRYAGRRFRSRIEARWGVFYDALGVTYDYEPQGFDLPSGRYLPDFYLADLDCWIEIKGGEPNAREETLATELAAASGKFVFIFYGSLYLPDVNQYPGSPASHVITGDRYSDWPYLWCRCAQCGAVGIHYEGRADRLRCRRDGHCRKRGGDGFNEDIKSQNITDPVLMDAFGKAMSARFEFGESGAPQA